MANCIVMFGGTFDPVHNGHLRAAIELQELLNADFVHLIVNHSPPHRQQPYASARQRLQMLQAGIGDSAGLHADDREIKRCGVSYSVDTLMSLRQQYGSQTRLIMAIGLDVLNDLINWHAPETLFKYAHIVVIERPQSAITLEPVLQKLIQPYQCDSLAELLHKPHGGFLYLPLSTALAISATTIRQLCAKKRSIRYLVPPSVETMIKQFHLYQSDLTE